MITNQEKKHNSKRYEFKFNPFEIFVEGNNSFNKSVFCKNILDNLSKQKNTAYITYSNDKVTLSDKKHRKLIELKELDLLFEKTIALDYELVLINYIENVKHKKIVFLDGEYNYEINENIIFFSGQEKYYKKLDTDIPFINETDIKQISERILSLFKKPELYGLILTGGKSSRMGQDKAFLKFHGINQYEYQYQLLSRFCEKVFISCREDQKELYNPEFNKIYDKYKAIGPMGGILSAFNEHNDKAWLVVACDLPLVNDEAISDLINQRDYNKFATAYISSNDNFPEPLCTIYEPKSKIRMMSFLSIGYDCARKFLINSETKLINQEKPEYLTNINYYSEYEKIING